MTFTDCVLDAPSMPFTAGFSIEGGAGGDASDDRTDESVSAAWVGVEEALRFEVSAVGKCSRFLEGPTATSDSAGTVADCGAAASCSASTGAGRFEVVSTVGDLRAKLVRAIKLETPNIKSPAAATAKTGRLYVDLGTSKATDEKTKA